jgi:lysophospholipid acyltransferase (LPLAT)-like uncharacterized protein
MKRIFRLSAVQPALAWLVGSYLVMALRTTRWDLHGGDHLAPFAGGKVVIAAFWHERLALMPMLWVKSQIMQPTKAANIHMLVSQHRDGRLIGSILRRFGVQVVHGSSSGGAVTAVRRAMALLQDGQQVAITPDGPRGPRRVAASGVAQNGRTLRRAGASLRSSDLAPARSAKLGPVGPATAVRSGRVGVRAPHSRATAGLGGIDSNDRDRADRGCGAR